MKEGMSLRSRIGIAFITMIVVPVLITGLIITFLLNIKLKSITKEYGIEKPTFSMLYNTSYMVSSRIDGEINYLRDIINQDPEKMNDKEFLSEENGRLAEKNTYIVLRKGNYIYFNGIPGVEDQVILQNLPSYEEAYGRESNYYYLQAEGEHYAGQLDFRIGDEKNVVYVVTAVTDDMIQIRSWGPDIILLIIFILVLTGVCMAYWIYKGIVTPLNELASATRKIRDGNLDFTVRTNTNINEIRALFEDFEEMRARLKVSTEEKVNFDKESKELISNISHDLKTPITAIKGYVEGIIDGVADTPEKTSHYIRTIYNKANEMDMLIDELTLYSKIDTNKIPYTFTKIPVSDYFDDCVDDLRMELSEKNIELAYFNYLEKNEIIIADAEQLKRVINNIISNSVKYMDKPAGIINIRLRDAGDFVQVEIEDNGKGIDRKDIGRIFDRFYRADASRNSSVKGSGIGLSIVKKILEDHEGKVWATSKEGVGTTVCFIMRKYIEVQEQQEEQHEQNTNNRRRRGNSKSGKGLS